MNFSKISRFINNFIYYMDNDNYENKELTGQNPSFKTKLNVFWHCKFNPTWQERWIKWKNYIPEWSKHDTNTVSTRQYKNKNEKRKTLVLPTGRQSKD